MRRLLADTNLFLYATGGDHALRGPSRTIVEAAGDGRVHLTISAEVLQEFAHVRRRRGAPAAKVVADLARLADLCEVVPLDREVMESVAALMARVPDGLAVRDLVMVATAVRAELQEIITADLSYDRVDGIVRVPPADLAEELQAG